MAYNDGYGIYDDRFKDEVDNFQEFCQLAIETDIATKGVEGTWEHIERIKNAVNRSWWRRLFIGVIQKHNLPLKGNGIGVEI